MATEFRVLGPLEVLREDTAVRVSSPKQRLLLCVLLARPNEVVSVDALVDALWGESVPSSAVALIQTYVSQLRKVVDGREPSRSSLLVRSAAGYRVHVDPAHLDADRFAELLERGRRALSEWRADDALGSLDESLDLWRGGPFGEFGHVSGLLPSVRRLSELRELAADERVDAKLLLGRHHEMIGELEARLLDAPLRERTWGQLMLCLYRSGRQADALNAYQRLRRHLGEELGLEPGAALRTLEVDILQQSPSLDWSSRPLGGGSTHEAKSLVGASAEGQSPVPPNTFRGRLPAELSRFVGREQELAEIAAMVDNTRLLTLVGSGGVGKTRVALQVAAKVGGRFPQGVWFVDLAPVETSASLDHAVGAGLGFHPQAGSTAREQLLDGLAGWQALLVVDNCEHLLAEVGELLRALLARGSGLSVLATSRAPLRVPGERVWQVGPLDLRKDAPELFVDRAKAARPDFDVDAATAPLVSAVCERLDCLPLALELAAARLRSMSAAELLGRLGDRFRLLRADRGGTGGRHATLAAAVEWSYDLLSPAAQRVLDCLWVFSGGFDLAAAHHVRTAPPSAGDELDTLELLDMLVDQSLVQVREIDGRTRYSMSETLRQYAAERARPTPSAESCGPAMLSIASASPGSATKACVDRSKRFGFDVWRRSMTISGQR